MTLNRIKSRERKRKISKEREDTVVSRKIVASSRFATTFRGHTDLFTKGLKGDGFVIKKAGTLEALAPMLGVNAEGPKKSVAAYNEAAAKGSDPEFNRNPKFLIQINTPPFYGWKGLVGVSPRAGACGWIRAPESSTWI